MNLEIGWKDREGDKSGPKGLFRSLDPNLMMRQKQRRYPQDRSISFVQTHEINREDEVRGLPDKYLKPEQYNKHMKKCFIIKKIKRKMTMRCYPHK